MSVNIKKGIKEMSEKLGKPEEELMAEMAKFESDLSAIFDDTDEVKEAAFKQLRGAYRAQMKSNAKTFEGFFFAMQPVRNENDYPIKEADKEFKKLSDVVGREEAVAQWQGLGKMDENEQYLFNADNTTEAMKWKRGKVIERYVPVRECYGFFKEPDVQGSKIRFGIVTMRHEPDKFVPSMLKVYRFRATGKPENSPLRLNGTAVTTLAETGTNINFDTFVKMISQDMPKSIKSFDEVYDLNKGICKVPENPRFFITKASISRFNVTDKPDLNINFADVTDLVGDFDPVSMSVSKDLDGVYENAIGIAIYAPYVKAKDQTAAGNLFGFVTAEGGAPKPAAVNKKGGKGKKNTEDENWE
jgi:hypothetical protein